MKRLINIILVAGLGILAVASCNKLDISANADFTTDKDVYELYEDINVTNVSSATNDIIVACKWEWGNEYKWGKHLTEPISFDSVGKKEIKLTVVTNNNVSATCIKTITIQDTNAAPEPDFEWTPTEGVAAGDEVQFIDKSTDPDGSVVAWEWKFGTTTITEQNPAFAFPEFGDIEVTLTVTDNMKKKASVKKTIHVDKSASSLELVWAHPYDNDAEAYAKFSSPATNADGSLVYAFSSGLHLVAFDADGNQKWSYDANQYGNHLPANPRSKDGSKTGSSCTPSVDADGTVYLALAYNEDYKNTLTTNESGLYAINPDGTCKWYLAYGNAYMVNVIPVILNDYIFVASKANPSKADYPGLWPSTATIVDNGLLVNKAAGTIFNGLQVKQGSYGGFAATKDENLIVHTNDTYGSRVFWKTGSGWIKYGSNDARDKFMLGYTGSGNPDCGFTTYMAVDANNRVYILYGQTSTSSSSTPGIVYCYDLNKYSSTDGITPEWRVTLPAGYGSVNRYYSHGTVLGEDGTVYVTTRKALTALNPSDGSVKWSVPASGDNYSIWGCPAVDNQGYIYFNESEQVGSDQTVGKLVKIKPDGTKASEIVLGTSLRTSPTISPDGTIYCTGMNDGKVTLFAVKGSATGPAKGWSQLGANSRKTCKAE